MITHFLITNLKKLLKSYQHDLSDKLAKKTNYPLYPHHYY